TPRDFQPSSPIGIADRPARKRHALSGLPCGCPYPAVGIHSALHSAIGLPSRASSAARMLAFLTPADVRRSFMRGLADGPQAIVEIGVEPTLWGESLTLESSRAANRRRPGAIVGARPTELQ